MNAATPDEVRAAIASHVLGTAAGSEVIGSVTLQKHQVEAVRRLREIIRAHGGALLADDVGLGKTFVGLAVAAEFERVVVVAPASLRSMWRESANRGRVAIRFVSMEQLGHGATIPVADLLIVDEAHHFRNEKTRRYGQLADGCARCAVLLLSATPVQNALVDLRRIVALIAGRRAQAMNLTQLGELIVRRGASVADASRLPRVEEPIAVALDDDADCLEQLCALPAPLPPSDGGYAQALMTLSLVRQWASSRAALLSALTRRLAMARAMEDALSAGRHLSRHELALWRFADSAQQLAFPELAADAALSPPVMIEQVCEHADALRALMATIRGHSDVDAVRAGHLAEIARRHPGERIVAFAEFTETVTTLYRHLARTHRAALLTHAGGRVAGGAVTRADVLRQFGPRATTTEGERIDLLLTTDVLSEGVDLQGASVVVHLDLTWNPARMEQRVGRLRRLGAARERVAVYLFSPPAPAERLLQLDRRLRAKLGDAGRSVGLAGTILPGVVATTESTVARRERVLAELERWSKSAPPTASPVSAVRWTRAGAIACVRLAGEVRLVACLDGRVDQNPPDDLLVAVAQQDAADCAAADVERMRQLLTAWMQRQALTQRVGLTTTGVARSRRAIIDRVNGIAKRSRRHERGALAAMLGAARHAATVTMTAGAERVLDQLARAQLPDDAWLRAIGEFGSIHGRDAPEGRDEILALLLLTPG
jgi:hypothetical protein